MADKKVQLHDSAGNNLFPRIMLDQIYPVGAIYLSTSATDPGTLFGGTWQRIQDRFLLAAGSSYAAGATGGAATHTLTKAQLPNTKLRIGQDMSAFGISATWYLTYQNQNGTGADASAKLAANANGAWAYTEALGSGQAHNNMPPYLAVYVWKRTA